jgi:hypothetical protein
MQRSPSLNPNFSASNLEDTASFNVVIAYEDFETGKHAKKTYDFLTEHLSSECVFTSQMWKFDVLGIPKLREIAARDAAAADIVVISCHGSTDLPAEVKAWIELWLAERTQPIALVALFDGAAITPATHAVRDYLNKVAIRGHMEFFAQPDSWPGQTGISRSSLQTLAGQTNASALPISAMVQTTATGTSTASAFPRWGINE